MSDVTSLLLLALSQLEASPKGTLSSIQDSAGNPSCLHETSLTPAGFLSTRFGVLVSIHLLVFILSESMAPANITFCPSQNTGQEGRGCYRESIHTVLSPYSLQKAQESLALL